MTFHTRSVAELGRLFVDLTDRLSREGLPATLAMLRTYFDAEAVLLTVECKHSGDNAFRELVAQPGSDLTLEKIVGKSGVVSAPHRFTVFKASFFDSEVSARYVIYFFQPDELPEFDEDERSLAELIISQLARDLKTNYHQANAERERLLYTSLVDRFEVGIIVLDQHSKILSVSERANQFLEKRDGLELINGRLCASDKVDDRKFQTLLAEAIAGSKRSSDAVGIGMSLNKKSSDRKLTVLLRHMPDIEHDWQGAVSIYIRDADTAPDVAADMMRQIFELTPAEASVARLLATGLSLEDTAIALDITRNTARAHLRSIFSKSGIKRQTELVRLVLNSAVIL